jgi:hypothetical protein
MLAARPIGQGPLRPRARAASAVPIDDMVQQLITSRQRPVPERRPPGGVSARDGAASSLAGSHCGGPAWVCCRRGGSRAYRLRPGAAVRETSPCSAGARSSRPAFRRLSGWRPWQDVPAVLNQARPSMYEMEGPCPASPRRQASCLVFAARHPPGPGTRARGRSPGSSRIPGVAPGGARFQR